MVENGGPLSRNKLLLFQNTDGEISVIANSWYFPGPPYTTALMTHCATQRKSIHVDWALYCYEFSAESGVDFRLFKIQFGRQQIKPCARTRKVLKSLLLL